VIEQGDDKGGDTATRDKQPGGCQSPVGKLTLLSKAPLSFLLVRVLFQLFVAALVGPRQWVGFTLRDNSNRGVQTNGEKHDPCCNEGCTDITISSLESHESFSALSRSFATIPTYSNWNDEGEHRAVMGEIGQVIHGACGPLLKEVLVRCGGRQAGRRDAGHLVWRSSLRVARSVAAKAVVSDGNRHPTALSDR
jgi:hypothetical protein